MNNLYVKKPITIEAIQWFKHGGHLEKKTNGFFKVRKKDYRKNSPTPTLKSRLTSQEQRDKSLRDVWGLLEGYFKGKNVKH